MGTENSMSRDPGLAEVSTVEQAEAMDIVEKRGTGQPEPSIDGLNQWIVEAHKKGDDEVPPISFGGVTVSLQASARHHSTPKSDGAERYTHVELGLPSEQPPDYIMEYENGGRPDKPTESIYSYVPIELVVRWMAEKIATPSGSSDSTEDSHGHDGK